MAAARKPRTAKPEVPDRTALTVLGMHRSGTSLLTRALNLLGYAVPETRIGINSTNESGHWESRHIARINDALLESAGLTWHDWGNLDMRAVPSRLLATTREDIVNIVHTEWGGADKLVIKEPRMCRFAPLYREALGEAGFRSVYAMPLRNPLEVMASLARRNGIGAVDAALLWLRYVLEAEQGTRGEPRAFLHYDGLIEDPVRELDRLCELLGLSPPYRPDVVAVPLRELADPGKRHHAVTAETLAHDPVTRGWVSNAFEALRVLAGDESNADAKTRLDAITDDFARATPALRMVSGALGAATAKAEARCETLSGDLAALRSERSRLADEVQAKDAAFNKATADAKVLETRIGRLSAQLANADSAKSQAESLLAELSEKEAETANLRSEKEEWARNRDRLRHKLSETEDVVRDRNAQLKSQRSRIRSLEREIWKLRDHMSVKSEHYEALLGSTSWRLTRPMRVAKRFVSTGRLRPKAIAAAPEPPRITHRPLELSDASLPRSQTSTAHSNVSRKDVEASGLFDPAYYVANTPSLGEADPLDHFLHTGWKSGADPSPAFTTKAYLAANPGSRDHPLGPLGHYLTNRVRSSKPAIDLSGVGRIAVFGAISGGYDLLKDPEADVPGVDYVLFTDGDIPEGSLWQKRDFEFVSPDPTRTARFVKIHPHIYFADYDWAVWVDANLAIASDPREWVAGLSESTDLATWIHPLRTRVRDEAEACTARSKDDADTIREQMERYRKEGFPDIGGLWETSVFASRPGRPAVAAFMNRWWAEILKGSRRDQLGLPYALWKSDVSIEPIAPRGVCMRSDPRFHYHRHMG